MVTMTGRLPLNECKRQQTSTRIVEAAPSRMRYPCRNHHRAGLAGPRR